MNVFGIGLPEMAVIAVIGLLVFGPKRLPELGKTLGRTLRGFQSASQEFEKELRQAVATPEAPPEPSLSAAEVVPAAAATELPPAVLAESSSTPASLAGDDAAATEMARLSVDPPSG